MNHNMQTKMRKNMTIREFFGSPIFTLCIPINLLGILLGFGHPIYIISSIVISILIIAKCVEFYINKKKPK